MKLSFMLLAAILLPGLAAHAVTPAEMQTLAKSRAGDLKLGCYITVDDTQNLIDSGEARAQALELLHGLGISRLYIETFRSGTLPDESGLRSVRDFFRDAGFSVVGGIATYPGNGFGVTSDTGLPWFNFQAASTQEGLENVVRVTARVFDEIIIDDFFCSGDRSAESDAVRGRRDWPEYRRDLLVALSARMVLGPAREENPNATVIMKFPQWYDLFHIYGYDLEREPQLYDRVYVGTETRGARTQRYGFTPAYMGFVNYRWIASLSGEKIGGAWYDHGDCDAEDFLDQAYQAVLAGAREHVIFSYGAFKEPHPGHQLLRDHFQALADLAALVRDHPVEGIAAYKPANSPAGTDLYLMDQLGMLGIPLVPVSKFPVHAESILLPTQAAKDKDILKKIDGWLGDEKSLMMTAGFLGMVGDEALLEMAGLGAPVEIAPVRTKKIIVAGSETEIPADLGLGGRLQPGEARVLLEASVDGTKVPFLLAHQWKGVTVTVLNSETFSQADFDAVNEVLLSPRRLGLLEVPREWADQLRKSLGGKWGGSLSAPARVTFQPLQHSGVSVLQNYHLEAVEVQFGLDETAPQAITLPARGHLVLKKDAGGGK